MLKASSACESVRCRSRDYESHLPGGRSFPQMLAWLRNYIGIELAWDVRLRAEARRSAERAPWAVPADSAGPTGSATRNRDDDADDLVLVHETSIARRGKAHAELAPRLSQRSATDSETPKARVSTMSEISRVALFGKLNPLLYKAIEGATVFCKLRGNPYVELVHWLHQILQLQDSDLHRIIRHFELDAAKLARDFTDALDRLPRGATSISDLSEHIENAVERAWVYGSLMYKDSQVRGGYLIVGILKTTSLRNVLHGISKEFQKVSADTLTDALPSIVKGSPEDRPGRGRRQPPGRRPARRGERRDGAGRRWASRRR